MKHLTVVLLDVISFFFLEEKSRIKLTVANKISVQPISSKISTFFESNITQKRGEKSPGNKVIRFMQAREIEKDRLSGARNT